MRVIGLMSGTSLDGVDAAWVETDGHAIQAFGPTLTVPYDDALRGDLREILNLAPGLAAADARVASVEQRLTQMHAQAVKALGQEADLIGFHGQTILHQPDRQRTWQIGDAALLARETGRSVAFDFRSADVAAGGQGAPLAPVYHTALVSGLPKPVAVLNIGGVANVTWIGPGGIGPGGIGPGGIGPGGIGPDGAILAFDTGPGNGPLDDWAERHTGQRFDRDGALARSGRVDDAVLGRLLGHPYFAMTPPKSLDRLDFAASLGASGIDALPVADGAATLAAFTVQAIVRAPLPQAPLRWLVTGGGRHNPVLMDGLRQALGVPVDRVDTLGWDGDALEAQCFGFLAARVVAGLPLSFPGTTGVAAPMTGGRVAHP